MKIKLFQCGGENSISEYPLGLGYLKSNCINADIQIVKSEKELIDCDLIGLSSNAWGIKQAINILNTTKIPVIIGGQCVLWNELKNYPFKHIIYGDGEISLQKIINGSQEHILNNRIENIDVLKFAERGKCGKVIPIVTSRGCMYSCSFCSSNAFWGKVRFHSTNYFMNEVEYILNQYPHAKELYILDDLFIGNIKRFREVYEQWMKIGLNKKLKLRSFIRSNILTLEIAQKMKDMGFRKIRFGAESGSDRVLKILNKKATVQNHQNAIDIANKIGLPISASFIYNIPGETKEDIDLTKTFINKNKGKLQIEGYYEFKSFPGIPMYDGSNPLTTNMKVR